MPRCCAATRIPWVDSGYLSTAPFEALTGSASWTGLLVGFSSGGNRVVGQAKVWVSFDTLSGQATFDRLSAVDDIQFPSHGYRCPPRERRRPTCGGTCAQLGSCRFPHSPASPGNRQTSQCEKNRRPSIRLKRETTRRLAVHVSGSGFHRGRQHLLERGLQIFAGRAVAPDGINLATVHDDGPRQSSIGSLPLPLTCFQTIRRVSSWRSSRVSMCSRICRMAASWRLRRGSILLIASCVCLLAQEVAMSARLHTSIR